MEGGQAAYPEFVFFCRRQRGRLWVDCTGREGRGRMFHRTHLLPKFPRCVYSRVVLGLVVGEVLVLSPTRVASRRMRWRRV